MNHGPISDDIEDAVSVNMTVCGCPHVHIFLFDETEQPFARAMLTPEQLAVLVRDVERALGHRLPPVDAGDTIGAIMGHG